MSQDSSLPKFDPPGALESAIVVVLGQNALTFSKAITLAHIDIHHTVFFVTAAICCYVVFSSVSLHWIALRHISHTATVYGNRHLIFDVITTAAYAVVGQILFEQVTNNYYNSELMLEAVGFGFLIISILNWCWNTVELRGRNRAEDAQAIITIGRARIMNWVSGSLALAILLLETLSLDRQATVVFFIWAAYWTYVLFHYLSASIRRS